MELPFFVPDDFPFFEPDRFIAQGVFNKTYDQIRAFKNGEGWANLPAVVDDAVKFRSGCLELGIEETAITISEDFSKKDFADFLKATYVKVKENMQENLNTLVIIDVSSHGVVKDGLCHVMCDSENTDEMMFNLENGVRQL